MNEGKKLRGERNALREPTAAVVSLILTCFFLSGLTGLIYEILWTKMISMVIGNAPFAVSAVLTVFMGGLGLGSYLAGRTIDRIDNPRRLIKLYGILEIAIGGYGLLLPLLLVASRPFFALLYNQLFGHLILYNSLTFIGCSVLLIPPVACMGATLPILSRFYVSHLSHLGTHVGRLYGLNTIGAALGSLLCGFLLIDLWGIWITLVSTVLLNVIIGASCLFLSRERKKITKDAWQKDRDSADSSQRDIGDTPPPSEYPEAAYGALVIYGVSGFCAMSYEVIWTKLLGLIIGPTTYSFTIVLATFISGLALGGMIFGRLADRFGNVIRLLICTQVAAALLALSVSQILGNSQFFFAKLIYQFKDDFALMTFLKATVLFIFMFLPTICLGATLPLVGKIYTRSVLKVGRSIGIAYSVNTIGAVLGSFCAGFLLVPFMGKEYGLSVVVGLQLFTSLVVGGFILWKRSEAFSRWVPLGITAVIGLFLCFHFPNWDRYGLSMGRYHRFQEMGIHSGIKNIPWWKALWNGPSFIDKSEHGDLVYYGDGIGGFTTVFKDTDPLGKTIYSLYNSGKPDASSMTDMATQTLLAHFGMLFHRDTKEVMVLGLASGITAGEVLNYPIERLDVIDINRQMVQASAFFDPWNSNVLKNPRTELIIQDGRAHLQLTKRRYDVIISEPSNPWMAGLANLYTHEFFCLVRNRLNNNGIFVQWIHSYQMDWETFALVGRTFCHVFPKSLLVRTAPYVGGGDWLLIGLKGEKELNLENAFNNLPFIRQSKSITLLNPKSLYGLITSEDLQRLFGPGPINTDNMPRLEFTAPKQMYMNDPAIERNIQSRKWLSEKTRNIIGEIIEDVDAQIDFAALALSLYQPFNDMVDLQRATHLQKEHFSRLVKTYCANNLLDLSIFNDIEFRQMCLSAQMATLRNRLDNTPDRALLYSLMGSLFYGNGLLDEAIEHYAEALRIKPDFAEAHHNIGMALKDVGRLEKAIVHYREALQIKPDYEMAHESLAVALGRQGNFQEAIVHFSEALRMKPDDPEIHFNMAIALVVSGRVKEAISQYQKALRLRPYWPEALSNLAWLLATHNDPEYRNASEAVKLAKQACRETFYRQPVMLDTLAAAYAEDGLFDNAVRTAEKALQAAVSLGRLKLARQIKNRMKLYQSGLPFHQSSVSANP